MSSLLVTVHKAGVFELNTGGKFRLQPKTSWLGLNPRLLCREFLALTAHTKALSTEH